MRYVPGFLLPSLLLLGGCSTAGGNASDPSIPDGWDRVPQARVVRSVRLDAGGVVGVSAEPAPSRLKDGTFHVVTDASGSRIANGLKLITENLTAVDSLDVSEEREEVAFSALRDGDYDIGLAATDGSATRWMPDDPADEVAVQWAPKGGKISYVIRAPGGDVVRTLHIPTAFQYAIPFENATVHALTWDAEGASYAVAYSTPVSSDRVEVLGYDGTPRTEVLAPASKLDVILEPFGVSGFAMRPADLTYNEKLPVVVWVDAAKGWNDARAALQRAARVAVVMTTREPTAELWTAIESTLWMDPARVYVIGGSGGGRSAVTSIVGDAAVPEGEMRTTSAGEGSVVSVAPAVVQSFAAHFIPSDLNRTTAPNGIRR
jgi:hypothetical protein